MYTVTGYRLAQWRPSRPVSNPIPRTPRFTLEGRIPPHPRARSPTLYNTLKDAAGPTLSRRRRARLLLVLAQLAVQEGEASAHEQGTGEDVAERDRDQVLQHDLAQSERRGGEEAERQDEHVGDRVLEADGDEGRDREPDAHHLARQVARRRREEDREADEPVAQHSLDDRLAEGRATLLDDGGRGGERDQPAADDVAHVRHRPVTRHLVLGHLALAVSSAHRARVAGKELATSLQDKEEVDGEERG